jgi:hypothetical protein
MPRGPDVRVKITEGHAKLVARDVYFWAWPMVNIYNRRLAFRNSVTFAKDQTPPVSGFWLLTLYNEHHFFAPNELKRYSLGTKNKTLKYNPDGSLTIYVQADPPPETQRANWLPAPKDADFSLYIALIGRRRPSSMARGHHPPPRNRTERLLPMAQFCPSGARAPPMLTGLFHRCRS